MIDVLNQIYKTLMEYKGKNIILVGHSDVDPDAIGSTCAMSCFLSKLSIEHKVLLEINEAYNIMDYKNFVYMGDTENLKCDLFISMDCGDKGRFFEHSRLFNEATCKINIDHHKSNDNFGDINYLDINGSSTSELVYDLISNYIEIDKQIAILLYAGIVFDTGGFLHQSTTPKTMMVASKLLECEINFNEIYYFINKYRSEKTISALKVLINNTNFIYDKKAIYSTLTIEDVEKVGATMEDTDGFVNFLFDIENVKVAIFIYQKNSDTFKVSLRSRNIDVSAIASVFGGGGHKLASGCKIKGEISDILPKVLEEVGKHIDE
ncbi:MAG: DHH family phosphoesterase [Lachnospirales bacterium]